MDTTKIWFVTGASKGLGLTLVQKLLANGVSVAATSRKLEDLKKAVGNDTPQFLPLATDLTSEASVQEAIEKTVAHFGRVDVIVNNAGYGLMGGVEELTDKEVRDNFEVNVFGVFNVIRKAMPYLRAQRSGHILNISSIGGFVGNFPGFGAYCATKFAVNGLSESLAEEVKAFGVHVTIVQPGYFRTNFLADSSVGVPQIQIDEYKAVRDSLNAHQNEINGKQPGDPEKGADAMIRIVSEANPPLNLFLGSDAFNVASGKLDSLGKELLDWKSVTVSTDF